jgi:PPP family 3-phenylpropionic acid transporter
LPLLVRIVANPLVTAYADRSGRLRETLVVCAAAVAVTTALLGVTQGFGSIAFVVVLLAMAQGPLIALTDALTLRLLRDRPAPEFLYGRIRLWGSIAFAAASLSTGLLLTVLAPWSIIALLAAAAAVVLAAAMHVPDGRQAPVPAERSDTSLRRAAPPAIVAACIAAAALIQASHAAVYAFSTLHWQSQGYSSAAMGALWTLGIVGEIGVFAFAGRYLTGERGAVALVVVGGAAAVARWLWMSVDPGMAALVVLQLSHGLTFASGERLPAVEPGSARIPDAGPGLAGGGMGALHGRPHEPFGSAGASFRAGDLSADGGGSRRWASSAPAGGPSRGRSPSGHLSRRRNAAKIGMPRSKMGF